MLAALDGAREEIITSLLAAWDSRDVSELSRLLRKFADTALAFVQSERSRTD